MLQSIKGYFKGFQLVLPIWLIHHMGIGYTCGYNYDNLTIGSLLIIYIIYMIIAIPVSFLMTVIIKSVTGVWSKIT